jgi:hypothetical protein
MDWVRGRDGWGQWGEGLAHGCFGRGFGFDGDGEVRGDEVIHNLTFMDRRI